LKSCLWQGPQRLLVGHKPHVLLSGSDAFSRQRLVRRSGSDRPQGNCTCTRTGGRDPPAGNGHVILSSKPSGNVAQLPYFLHFPPHLLYYRPGFHLSLPGPPLPCLCIFAAGWTLAVISILLGELNGVSPMAMGVAFSRHGGTLPAGLACYVGPSIFMRPSQFHLSLAFAVRVTLPLGCNCWAKHSPPSSPIRCFVFEAKRETPAPGLNQHFSKLDFAQR